MKEHPIIDNCSSVRYFKARILGNIGDTEDSIFLSEHIHNTNFQLAILFALDQISERTPIAPEAKKNIVKVLEQQNYGENLKEILQFIHSHKILEAREQLQYIVDEYEDEDEDELAIYQLAKETKNTLDMIITSEK